MTHHATLASGHAGFFGCPFVSGALLVGGTPALAGNLALIHATTTVRPNMLMLSESKSHPRAWGTFTRILGRYVREERLLTLEEAIRKMTSQAAIRVGITDRGLVRPGLFADLTIFDPATVREEATFENPTRYSTGVRYVFVNGRPVVADGRITSERPGRPLRGPGTKTTPRT